MIQHSETNSLVPFNWELVQSYVPELNQLDCKLVSKSILKPIDSANIKTENWVELASIIEKNYEHFDGFVILHGSDTMAYTASALSFMLQNTRKTIVLTGSQLPIGDLRTDAKEHLITSIQIAADTDEHGHCRVPEVCVYFANELMRGNRSRKHHADKFSAFMSPNYPLLAEAGVAIEYHTEFILPYPTEELKVHKVLNTNVGSLKLFPSIQASFIECLVNQPQLKALVLEAYGSGNAPTEEWFLSAMQTLLNKGVVVVVITQCAGGIVDLGHYETSSELKNLGIIDGEDLTFEACITKLMFLLGKYSDLGVVKNKMQHNLCGELRPALEH